MDSPGYLMSEKSRLVRVKQKSKWNNLQNVLCKYLPAMSTLVGRLSYKCDYFLKLSGYLDLYFKFFFMKYYLAPYSIQMRENRDQKKLRIWTLFTQWHWLFNKSADKIFLRKTIYTFLYFKNKFALSIAESFKNIYFYHIVVFTLDKACYISNKCQPPDNFAKYQSFYTRDFMSLLHFKTNWPSPSQTFYKTSIFYHTSIYF